MYYDGLIPINNIKINFINPCDYIGKSLVGLEIIETSFNNFNIISTYATFNIPYNFLQYTNNMFNSGGVARRPALIDISNNLAIIHNRLEDIAYTNIGYESHNISYVIPGNYIFCNGPIRAQGANMSLFGITINCYRVSIP